jgi:hypothetical protein
MGTVNMNDPKTPPGVHEFRFIASTDTRQSERWECSVQVVNGGPHQQVKFEAPATWSRSSEKPLMVSASTSLPEAIVSIRHDWETIATLETGAASIPLPQEKLGRGPVRLQAVAKLKDFEVYSFPVVVDVTP